MASSSVNSRKFFCKIGNDNIGAGASIERLIATRKSARKAKDFAGADAIKKQLTDMGIELRDKPDGTTEWKVK